MKNGVKYFKYSVLLICFLVGAFLFRGCNCGKEKIKQVPVVRVDTFWKKQDTFISYVPKPYKVLVPDPVLVINGNSVSSDEYVLAIANRDAIIENREDTIKALREYLSIKYFDTTFKVKYGTINFKDTLFRNSFIGRGFALNQQIPEITKTYTIEARKRNVVLFGVGALGNKTSPLYGTSFTLDLKNRQDRIYEVGGMILKGGDFYYSGSIKWPIRLSKK